MHSKQDMTSPCSYQTEDLRSCTIDVIVSTCSFYLRQRMGVKLGF
jgi:hypothetical protein